MTWVIKGPDDSDTCLVNEEQALTIEMAQVPKIHVMKDSEGDG